MENKEDYIKILNLLDITLTTEYQPAQLKILDILSKNLNT